jgi:Na+/proline symporter
MAPLDWLIVIAFAAYAVTAGLRSRAEASRSLESYFLAGRSLPGWKAGISMAATHFAADTPLLVTGLIATA